MKAAIVSMVAAALGDPSTGVNAKLASVPRVSGHTQPSNVTVYHELDDHDSALGRTKEAGGRPSVQVQLAGLVDTFDAIQNTPVRDYTATILIRIARADDETAQGSRALAYTTDAVIEALRAFHLLDPSARTLAGVVIEWARSIKATDTIAPDNDTLLTSAVLVEYQARYTPS